MPFQKIEAEKLSSSVVKQIELLILRGILRPGERLPSERELAEKLGVSRPSLREAVSALQERGLLASKAGAGIFVADVLGSGFSQALIDLFASHDEAVFDYISFRRDLEGLAAERAARPAHPAQLLERSHMSATPNADSPQLKCVPCSRQRVVGMPNCPCGTWAPKLDGSPPRPSVCGTPHSV